VNTAIEFGIKFGSVASAAGIAASHSLIGFTILTVAVSAWWVAHEIRLALRERRDDATVRHMFAQCDQPTIAFARYTEVLKARDDSPP
jgi:hypothetical protein